MENSQTKFKETELGLIPEDWKVFKLDDLGTFRGGVTSIKRDDYGFGTPFITYKNIFKNSRIKIDQLELMNVPEKDIDRFDCKFGDIFFTASSETYDEIAMSSVLLETVDKLTFNGFSKRLRLYDFSKLLPEYARYVLRSRIFRNQVEEKVTGDVRFNASQEMLGSIKMPLPPLPEQQKIAEVLGALDEKIELNRKMNKTLESLAQAVFKKWFVDNADPNWETKKLGKFINIHSGFAFSSNDFDPEGKFGLVTIKNVQDGSFITACTNRIETPPPKMPAYNILGKGEIILSLTGNVGRVCFVYGEDDYLLNQRVAKLAPHNPRDYGYTYFLFRQKEFQDYLIAISRGTAQQNLSPVETSGIDFQIPSSDILDKYSKIANPIMEKIVANMNEIETLSQTRDSLLPRLMSGKLRVR